LTGLSFTTNHKKMTCNVLESVSPAEGRETAENDGLRGEAGANLNVRFVFNAKTQASVCAAVRMK
jgi:hypothetical protein